MPSKISSSARPEPRRETNQVRAREIIDDIVCSKRMIAEDFRALEQLSDAALQGLGLETMAA